jgi:hypothetical protein
MPVVLKNHATSIEISVSFALTHYVNKGDFDVIMEDIGAENGVPIVFIVMRSKAITENFIKLDWRDVSEPTVASAEELRDLILSWNTQQAITTVVTKIASSTDSQMLLALNEKRKMATIYNNSTAYLYLKYGEGASLDSFSIRLIAGDYLELPPPCYLGRIDGVWADADGSAMVTEIT